MLAASSLRVGMLTGTCQGLLQDSCYLSFDMYKVSNPMLGMLMLPVDTNPRSGGGSIRGSASHISIGLEHWQP